MLTRVQNEEQPDESAGSKDKRREVKERLKAKRKRRKGGDASLAGCAEDEFEQLVEAEVNEAYNAN